MEGRPTTGGRGRPSQTPANGTCAIRLGPDFKATTLESASKWAVGAIRTVTTITAGVLPKPRLISSSKSGPVSRITVPEMLGVVRSGISVVTRIFPPSIESIAVAVRYRVGAVVAAARIAVVTAAAVWSVVPTVA